MVIRLAEVGDARQIRAIYAPYVATTAVSFEYEIPSVAEMERRIAETKKKYPYLVAVEDGRIVGYTYASAFHGRIAYQHSVELSLYVDRSCHGRGIGRRLYRALEKCLLEQNVVKLYACITSTDRENDRHLTDGSIRFHEKMGYTPVGRHESCGYKFGKWYTANWLEKEIAPLPEHPAPFVAFPQIG